MDDLVTEGNKVLIIWSPGTQLEDLQDFVTKIKEKVGKSGSALLENSNQIIKSNHETSSIDVILSGVTRPFIHDEKLLGELLRVLKPGGKLAINEPVVKDSGHKSLKTCTELMSKLKLNGFLLDSPDCKSSKLDNLEQKKSLSEEHGTDDVQVCNKIAKKPQFEAS